MSHFTCLVIIENYKGKKDETINLIDEALAPYMENCCGEPERKYMEFYDVEAEYRKRYEEEKPEYIVMPDGRLLSPYDKEFAVKDEKMPFTNKYVVPVNLKRRNVDWSEIYPTFEAFIEEYCGYKKDDLTGKYGYWENPNAKWDWYEIGGRWAGFFKLKKGHKGFQGKQYNFSQEYPASNRADICFKCQVDLEGIRKEKEVSAAIRWDKVAEITKGLPSFKTWDEIKDDFEVGRGGSHEPNDIEAARKAYWAQPAVKAYKEFSQKKENWELLNAWDGPDEYRCSREEYLDRARRRAITTHAFVKDGKWHEHGRMMMFATIDPDTEKDEETWESIYSKMLDELPDDALLCLCDCHI